MYYNDGTGTFTNSNSGTLCTGYIYNYSKSNIRTKYNSHDTFLYNQKSDLCPLSSTPFSPFIVLLLMLLLLLKAAILYFVSSSSSCGTITDELS